MTDKELRQKVERVWQGRGFCKEAKNEMTTTILDLIEQEKIKWFQENTTATEVELQADRDSLQKAHNYNVDKIAELQAELKATEEASELHCRDAVKLQAEVETLKLSKPYRQARDRAMLLRERTDECETLRKKLHIAKKALEPFADSNWYYTWTKYNTNAKQALEKLG